MAAGKTAVEFEEIIKTDRLRRKNEALAKEIFGAGRRSSAPGAGPRKPGTGPSLASRIGVTKQRSTSNTRVPALGKQKRNPAPPGDVNAEWTHDLFGGGFSAASGAQRNRDPKTARITKEAQLYSAINSTASSPTQNSQFNIIGGSKPITGLSIRGLAGPCIVVAENFAPGTTAEDIESAMAPYGGLILKCRLLPSIKTVIAEIVFDTREGAEKVIAQFNNQIADGLVLSLYHKSGLPPSAPGTNTPTPTGPRADLIKNKSSENNYLARYDRFEPRNNGRRYDATGSVGFEDRMDTDVTDDNEKGKGRGRLYSDSIVSSRGLRRRGRGDSRNSGNGHSFR